MPSIRRLTELSALASAARSPEEAVQRALPILREGLAAMDVFLVYGGERSFRHFGSRPDLELTDMALAIVNQDLVSRGEPCAFDLRDGRVVSFRSIGSRRPCDYVAALIPMADSAVEMLVARGLWLRGLGASRRHFLRVALPTLALLLERRFDSARAERQRNVFGALANITRVLSESEDMETVLTSMARTTATVTGIHYISIDIVDQAGNVELRCVNSVERMEEAADRWKRGASRPDPVRDFVLSTRQPILFRDTQTDERIPESGRNFFKRALLRSTGCFPLLTRDEVLGILSVASQEPLEFSGEEVELLEGFAAQVANAVKGIRLYQELAESREQLRALNEQLHQSMEVQHHLARTDALTGIPNRRSIDEAVDAEVARARRYGRSLSVAIADLDELKLINDGSGHDAGDEALKFMASLARESCREVDLVGRYGGDEFVFVLPATGLQEATVFAERFRQRLAESLVPIRVGAPIRLTVSLGVAQWDNETMDTPVWLIRQADRAMYAAKEAGRNRTMVAEGDTARAA